MPWTERGGKDDSNIASFCTTSFVGCYVINAFSIASDFDPKLMPKVQNQIMMRKAYIVIQSLLSRCPNYHSDYS